MIVLLLTTQEKVGERIAARLRSKYNYIVQTFTSARKFMEAAYDEGPSRIDLLMFMKLCMPPDSSWKMPSVLPEEI